MAKLEIRDENLSAAEGHYVSAIAKCEEAYGKLSPEAGGWSALQGGWMGKSSGCDIKWEIEWR